METPVKNKPIVHQKFGRIVVSDVIPYSKTGPIMVRYSTGFGASEQRHSEKYNSVADYTENFLNKIVKEKSMTENLVKVAEDDIRSEGNPLRAVSLSMFEAMEGIKNKTLTVDQAKCMSALGQTVINAVKTQLDLEKFQKYSKNK